MASFMEFIYIDADGDARQTNLRRSLDSDAATWSEFNGYRRLGVDIKEACFLLDYHNRKGDLADTIALDIVGFHAVTGQMPKTDAEYRKIDGDFWEEVQQQRAA